ncbi:MAG: shikimate dehydrogenase family protein, partial [Rhodobacterales bacterium]
MAEPISATITGKTRVLGILAHPTDHVKAPPGINAIARKRGRDAVMVPLNVAPADLPAVVAALRLVQSFDGAIVTVPHKQAILSLCDQISPEARAVGAANVLRREPDGRLVAGQLDGIGFLAGLRDQGIDV